MTDCIQCGAECPDYRVLVLGDGIKDFCTPACCTKWMDENGVSVVFFPSEPYL